MESKLSTRMKLSSVKESSDGAQPMDVDAFVMKGKGKSKNGKGSGKPGKSGKHDKGGSSSPIGKGKGTDKKFEGTCHICQKPGHKAADCWHRAGKSDGGGKTGKGKGAGKKGGKSVNLIELEAAVGAFDLCAFVRNLDVGQLQYMQEDWMKCCYDTGCSRNVMPKEVAGVFGSQISGADSGASYKTATGEIIDDKGETTLVVQDENGRRGNMKMRVAAVHKPLVSAMQMSKTQDAWITAGGGYLVDRNSPCGIELSGAVERILSKYQFADTVPLYQENGVYNFYVKPGTVKSAVKFWEKKSAAWSSGSGFTRQAQEGP
jgi:hypothetical protein